MKLVPMQYPSNEKVMGFNVMLPCVICRTSKRPFQMAVRLITIEKDRKPIEVVESGSNYCQNCNEPFFPSPAKRTEAYEKLALAQAKL